MDSHSVNLSIAGKRECLFLPKEFCQVSDDTVDKQNVNFVKNNYRSVTTQFSLRSIKFIIWNKSWTIYIDLNQAVTNRLSMDNNYFVNKGDWNSKKW